LRDQLVHQRAVSASDLKLISSFFVFSRAFIFISWHMKLHSSVQAKAGGKNYHRKQDYFTRYALNGCDMACVKLVEASFV